MSEESDQFELPGPLVDALRDAFAHRVEIPGSRDQFILSATRAKFAQRRRMRLIARWGTGLAAGIAAMIVVAISLHHPAATRSVVKGDINADGQLNIVDALALARHLADKDRLEKAWDINGDGVIDQRDVDALAQAAVSLKQGGLVNRGLPKLRELGIERLNVGFASANAILRDGRVPCPPEPRASLNTGEALFGSGGHVVALATMPTPADRDSLQSLGRQPAGEGMAPSANRSKTFAKANPTIDTKNTNEESR